MFDHAVLDVRSGRAVAVRAALLPVSIAIHSVLFGVVLWVAVWTVHFPIDAPPLASAFRFGTAIPVPPAAPLSSTPAQQPVQRTTPVDTQSLASSVIPDQVPVDVSPGSSPSTTASEGGVGGAAGSEYGIEGSLGVIDGSLSIVGSPVETMGPRYVTGDVKAPVVINRVAPVYPMPARMLRKSGFVEVECVIDRFGNVRDVSVVRSDFPPFSEEAVRAVRQWRFRPGTLHGRAVDVIFRLTVEFKMQ